MEKCPGVISIHDDIVIYGTSDQDHDANLINLLNVAQLEARSKQDPGQRQTALVLAQTGCRYYRLCEKMPGMYQKGTPSQRATASS